MDQVEQLVKHDPLIKGIWCVPRYSNPTGHTYSNETVARMAELAKLAGDNFRVMWDNAYAVHHLRDKHDELANLMDLAREAGTQDSVVMLASTLRAPASHSSARRCRISPHSRSSFPRRSSASTR